MEEGTRFHDRPIRFAEDWSIGIGGGLWSTGSAMGEYFLEHPIELRRHLTSDTDASLGIRKDGGKGHNTKFALELGSGNGYLSVVLALVLGTQKKSDGVEYFPKSTNVEVAVTDTAEHLPLIRATIESNLEHLQQVSPNISFVVTEHVWVDPFSTEPKDSPLRDRYDFIFGTDVAYRDKLHDPLISSLKRFFHQRTVCLIGVTMLDTSTQFFSKLSEAGFRYERISDNLLDDKFEGDIFGLFIITREDN